MAIRQIGIDIGKNTFHVIGLGAESGIELRKLFTRSQLLGFFEGQSGEALNVAFEACSGAHWLAHRLTAMGHTVMLLTPESVRPFAKAQKNDWNDALAIAEAARRPDRHAVGIKSEERLDLQALHRVRQRLMTARTAIINQLRGLLRERGLVIPGGRARFERHVRQELIEGGVDLSPVSRALFATLIAEYNSVSTRLADIDRDLEVFAKSNPVCRALPPIPGVGVIVATALYSAVANISDFKTGRDLAAFLGLVGDVVAAAGAISGVKDAVEVKEHGVEFGAQAKASRWIPGEGWQHGSVRIDMPEVAREGSHVVGRIGQFAPCAAHDLPRSQRTETNAVKAIRRNDWELLHNETVDVLSLNLFDELQSPMPSILDCQSLKQQNLRTLVNPLLVLLDP